MTQRKPIGLSYETWIDRQIREAESRGDFENLPGKGKPIPNLDRPWTLDNWARDMAKREGVSLLPPGLQLRRDVEKQLEEIMQLAREEGVRAAVAELNQYIRETNRNTHDGPESLVHPKDIDEVVARWKNKHT